MKQLLAAASLLALAACASLQQFTAGDLANATAIAKANGDTTAATCWTAMGGAVMVSPDPSTDGLAVLAERQRLLQGVATGPCAAIILPIILQLGAKALPGV